LFSDSTKEAWHDLDVAPSYYKKVAIERIRRTLLSLGYIREHLKKEENVTHPNTDSRHLDYLPGIDIHRFDASQ
jgi:hypothetical protein